MPKHSIVSPTQAEAFQRDFGNSYTYDFRTPDYLLWYIHEQIMPITHDGACSQDNNVAKPLNVDLPWDLTKEDGVYINPPWDMPSIIKWCAKARTTEARATLLLPNKLTDTRYQKYVGTLFDHLVFLGGRIDFSGPVSAFRKAGSASRWGCFLGTLRCGAAPGYSMVRLLDLKRLWINRGSPLFSSLQ